MRWFRDAFCAEEKLIAERLGIDAYSLLEIYMASQVPPGAHGVIPIFSDVMRFKHWYHAAPSFINLSIDPEKCNKALCHYFAVRAGRDAAIVSACNLQPNCRVSAYRPTRWFLPTRRITKANYGAKSLPTLRDSPFTYLSSKLPPLGCAIAARRWRGYLYRWRETGEKR
ncbi:hypothetical protein KCP76_10760 [Salmonella enterica subsp. enterica serovar Weltevreden]|nr:hypothetical protein KCP76_10760 [Salmonella enterica subsp. enterica serovar Weltevreden]